jgi:surface polysaccharide O-acyltransferase-like enzyme
MERPTARDLAEATPSSRNRYVDLLRVVSIGVVVLGHWTMAVLGYHDGRFTGANLLELNPDLQILTWVFQVMPLFFIVGGFTSCASWASATQRGVRYADWIRGRSVRLLRPAIWFVAFWAVIPVVGVALGLLSPSVARIAGEEVALPLWFLSVYLLAMLAVPPLVTAHRRFGGPRVFAALVVIAFIVDNLHFGLDVPVVGALNYATIWLALLELGYLWRGGRLDAPTSLPWAMIVIGLGALVVMTTWFDYPVSMIGLTHAPRSNAQPPSLALLALGVWQLGAALLLQAPVNRWLRRTRPWTAVVAANSMVMTFYLWNMSAVVLAALVLFRTGVAPQPEPLSAAWWWLRPAWWLACAICLLPFLLGFRWAERPAASSTAAPAGRVGTALVVGGTVAAGAGLAVIAAKAFPVPDALVLVPAIGVVLFTMGTLAVRVDPFAPLRARVTDRR